MTFQPSIRLHANASANPVVLELISNALTSIANRITGRMIHAAQSGVIKEAEDCSAAIFDPAGQLLAESHTVPILRNAIRTCMETILSQFFPLGSWADGDAVVTNDPYAGEGSFSTAHTNDFCIIQPVFWEGRIVAFAGMMAHHVDIGSRDMAGQGWNESIFQEGIRIPPLKIARAGAIDQNLMAVILNNSRVPEMLEHDLTAQITCNGKAIEDVLELFAKYGLATMQDSFRALIDYTEERTRAEIARIPDGTYRSDIPVLDDGSHGGPFFLRIAITKSGTDIAFDFTGTDPQIVGPINAPLATVWGAVLFTLRCMMDPTIPSTEGCIRPITVTAPKGSLVNAAKPAAVWQRMLVCQSLIDLIMTAFDGIGLDRAIADSAGVQYHFLFSRTNTAPLFLGENEAGGTGASRLADGISVVTPHLNNCPLPQVEVLEATSPVRYLRREFRQDSGGPGRFRGGLGQILQYQVLRSGLTLQYACQKYNFAPRGRGGGNPGATVRLVINEGTDREIAIDGSNGDHALEEGDTITLRTPGGGGFGDPRERDRAAVRADVARGYVSVTIARDIYGLQEDPMPAP